ncbi:MAG: RNA methyltransferase [Elusimicrobia bacterium]|nr:RNA methyltransferase [Elusimicrobiota bacterium]
MELRIVLVRPRDPNNIGACARAMANFGVRELWVVAPHPPVWREAKSAVGAVDLLAGAREAAAVSEAVRGCRTIWATSSLTGRRPSIATIDLPLEARPPGPAALLFGPEKTGLNADDLAHASAILRIPTGADCPSMNLAAAVAVACYAWTREAPPPARGGPAPATARLRERLWLELRRFASQAGWQAGERTRRLKAAVYRSNVSDGEAGMLLELGRRLMKRCS